MKNSKIICVLLAALLLCGLLSGCTSAETDNVPLGDDALNIVVTIFPEYDWVRQILGDNAGGASLTMLLDNGVDLHSYQPTADDIIQISTCDLFIYVGGESDSWVADALKETENEDQVVIDMMDVLGDAVQEEEVVEGMQTEEEAGGEEEPEYDEHVWLSLKNAKILCAAIADAMGGLDAENAPAYAENAATYISRLDALDSEYQTAVDEAFYDTILFGDRFPFRYLADDYSLNYYAAFVGCSAETEASFETIAFLAGKLDELGLPAVLTIEGTTNSVAQTVVSSTAEKNQSILSMDSMQSVTTADVNSGETYLSIMEDNLNVLKTALN